MNSLSERHVQAIWYDASLRPKRLSDCNGAEISVVSPGEWNLGPGPDFRNAVLEIGKGHQRVCGDVEVHLCPSDWDLHGHGTDPRYRNVIAHVTWHEGLPPKSMPMGTIAIWLGRLMAGNAAFSPEQIDLMAYPYAKLPMSTRPCEEMINHNPELAKRILLEAGRHRLRMKARRIIGRLCEGTRSRRQVFYEEVMTAFGYRRNSRQFRHVAERVPIDEMPKDTFAAKNAMLVAGEFEDWDRIGMRPNNAPEKRLSDAAEVFTSTPLMKLAETTDFSRAKCKAMVAMLCNGHCLGRGRAAAILANVITPFAIAEDRMESPPDWLPPEDISEPVRLTAFRLFGRDHNPAALYSTNGVLIQGMLQIHRDYCLRVHPDCGRCGLLVEH